MANTAATRSPRVATRWTLLALVWSVALGVVWSVAPVVGSTTVTVDASGAQTTTSGTRTLLASEGPGVLLPLAVPVVLCAIALAVPGRRARFALGGVLAAGCLLAAASIGLPYLPAAITLLLAAASTPARSAAARATRLNPG